MMVVYDKDDLAPMGLWPVIRSHRTSAEHAALVAAARYVVEVSRWNGSLGNAPGQFVALMEGIFAMSQALPKGDDE